MLKITAEEVNFIIYQYLNESGKLGAILIYYLNRVPALGLRLFLGSKYARKQIRQLHHPRRPPHRFPREGPRSNPHGDPSQ
jgi:hypothetical protein